MLLKILFHTSSIVTIAFLATSCGSVERPNANLCGINSPASQKECYNLRTDFNDDGTMQAGVKPKIVPLTGLKDLNANICMDPDSLKEVKRYVSELRKDYEDLKARCNILP